MGKELQDKLKKCFQIYNLSFIKRFVCHYSKAFKLWVGFSSELTHLRHGGKY